MFFKELDALFSALCVALSELGKSQKSGKSLSDALLGKKVEAHLRFRWKLVQVIGGIKYLNQMPIENLAMESALLDDIAVQARLHHLDVDWAQGFVNLVMVYSKKAQWIVFDLFGSLGSQEACWIMLDELIDQLHASSVFINEEQVALLKNRKTVASQKLELCRQLIQRTTLNLMQHLIC
jgi:chorismate mutase